MAAKHTFKTRLSHLIKSFAHVDYYSSTVYPGAVQPLFDSELYNQFVSVLFHDNLVCLAIRVINLCMYLLQLCPTQMAF